MTADQPTAYLVDASIYVFRAWFSLPDSMTGADGRPVNAVYGYLRFLAELCEQTEPRHILVAFDESLTSSFRNELYPAYKANRELPPAELEHQFALCRELTHALGIPCQGHPRFEADDLIASAAARLRNHDLRCVIVSSDKDLTQVLGDGDLLWDFARDRRLDVAAVHARFGIAPHQVSDYLALVGDGVDNIPGVPGIGPKSASRLLRLYPDLETIYAKLDQVAQLAMRGAGRIAANLREHREQAFLARRLTTVARDAPVSVHPDGFRVTQPDDRSLRDLVQRLDRGQGYVERIRTGLGN